MKTSDLIFIGIKGSVVAVYRSSGQQAWSTHLKGSDFVNVALEDDLVLATTYGEIFALDPLTGEGRWHNPLKGYGLGLATIAMGNGKDTGQTVVLAEKRRRDEERNRSDASFGSTNPAGM